MSACRLHLISGRSLGFTLGIHSSKLDASSCSVPRAAYCMFHKNQTQICRGKLAVFEYHCRLPAQLYSFKPASTLINVALTPPMYCLYDSGLLSCAARAQIEQQIFGHTATDNSYAKQLQEQAREHIPEIEEFTQEFLDDLLRISQTVLRGLALALGQPENFFTQVSLGPFTFTQCVVRYLAGVL